MELLEQDGVKRLNESGGFKYDSFRYGFRKVLELLYWFGPQFGRSTMLFLNARFVWIRAHCCFFHSRC